MMLRSAFTIAVICGSTLGAAAQRLDTTQMNCGQARKVVATQGAAVLGSGPGIYDRYVNSDQFCMLGEVARQAFAPTRDNAWCPVGYRCETRDNTRFFDD